MDNFHEPSGKGFRDYILWPAHDRRQVQQKWSHSVLSQKFRMSSSCLLGAVTDLTLDKDNEISLSLVCSQWEKRKGNSRELTWG